MKKKYKLHFSTSQQKYAQNATYTPKNTINHINTLNVVNVFCHSDTLFREPVDLYDFFLFINIWYKLIDTNSNNNAEHIWKGACKKGYIFNLKIT